MVFESQLANIFKSECIKPIESFELFLAWSIIIYWETFQFVLNIGLKASNSLCQNLGWKSEIYFNFNSLPRAEKVSWNI